MRVRCFTVGMFQVNTYLLTDEATGRSAVVDTGETGELVERLRRVEDPREDRGLRHSLVEVLFIALVAMVSGADDAEAMQDYGEANADWFGQFL